ncbi:potassium-transporting ATPase, C subunit [Fulvimarina pelagi HTCC2506]|uniref:Potassium-transporting ATPase KdpC subunit n=2 Tax=Fulvimarina pelagi TaxID=217511 RepID=Q0G2W6_9HYPH|nr:potassium-transporting ATPase subunit C [Fulvimarina pelagi]EAU42065.1 potassium-transporting ATPase, C subunit [Fulvimarina pelagi HTCC2506]BAT31033.1 potassium-transporting ATPase, C subunit [Fulvimarina pelagi]
MLDLISGLRVAAATMIICVVGYTALVLGFAQAITPATANGSLIANERGEIVGSQLIAQAFTSPEYFWPRPSAVDFDASGAGGSNLSPANPALTERAVKLIAAHTGATEERPIPADLVTASGAGLDPHISLEGALFQAPRIAAARGVEISAIAAFIRRLAYAPGAFFTEGRIVNVLELNLALDAELAASEASN